MFGRRKDHITAGLTYAAEFSANLKIWSKSSDGLVVLSGEVGHEIEVVDVTFPANVPLNEGSAEQGNGHLLRVWEQAGVSGTLAITLPTAIKAAQATPLDLRGQATGKPFPITHSTLTFDLPANAPASFLID